MSIVNKTNLEMLTMRAYVAADNIFVDVGAGRIFMLNLLHNVTIDNSACLANVFSINFLSGANDEV